jgi:hypothetical protein
VVAADRGVVPRPPNRSFGESGGSVVRCQISESDWKLLRRLEPLALDRHCPATLSEVVRLASNAAPGSHPRYLEVFQLIRERDEQIEAAYNDRKRSTALVKLARTRSLGIVTDEKFAGFRPETQAAVALFLEP